MNKTKTDIWKKLNFSSAKWSILLSPLLLAVAMLCFFGANGLYPFGQKSISWCDMDQQVVPLLLQFKDVLLGKEGFFFSFKNAGGMNWFGVFFFFLSSPFSLLVAFVDKSELLSFMNVLVMLKMCLASCTAAICFSRRFNAQLLPSVALALLYGASGYVMMYYQNVIWLDMVCLFPLLLFTLDLLKTGKKLPFILVLAAHMIVNYYVGYMTVVFLLLYAFVEMILEGKKAKRFAVDFCGGCFGAALLSAVVWLPSLLQYFSSGRGSNVFYSLVTSPLFTRADTTYITVLSVLFLFPFAFGVKSKDKHVLSRKILLALTLAPIVLEPVNRMWQTGSYMSFPTRYAFMTIFLALSLAFDCLCQEQILPQKGVANGQKTSREESALSVKGLPFKRYLPWILGGVALLFTAGYCLFAVGYTEKNVEVMSKYAQTLWGDTNALKALCSLYFVAVLMGVIWFTLHRKAWTKPVLTWLGISVVVLSELCVSPVIYMNTPAHEPDWYQQVVDMGERVEDEGFFRVKTDKDYTGHDFDVNMMGGIGYNALGHYTSLTDADYMTAIKQWGYTSYWMEVGNSGGTILSDALLSVKYQISNRESEDELYANEYFHLSPTGSYLPLGIVAKEDVIAKEVAPVLRGELQQRLYQDFFLTEGEQNAVRVYSVADATLQNVTAEELSDGRIRLTPTGTGTAKIVFSALNFLRVQAYFNVFDQNTNALSQAINGKFDVRSAWRSVKEFPSKKNNGVLDMGEFNGSVTVSVTLREEAVVSDFSLITVDKERFFSAVEKTETLALSAGKNKIEGKYVAKEGGQSVFLSLPYNEGWRLTVNGKSRPLYRVYGGFSAFYLQAGENEIRLQFTPKGFALGGVLSVSGAGILAVAIFVCSRYFVQKTGKDLRAKYEKAAETRLGDGFYWLLLSCGALAVFAVYVLPIALCYL